MNRRTTSIALFAALAACNAPPPPENLIAWDMTAAARVNPLGLVAFGLGAKSLKLAFQSLNPVCIGAASLIEVFAVNIYFRTQILERSVRGAVRFDYALGPIRRFNPTLIVFTLPICQLGGDRAA